MSSKNNLERLQEKKATQDMSEMLGPSNLTLVSKVSGNRAQMWNGQIEQMVCLKNPEIPRVFTGFEHVYGKFTDGRKKAKVNYKILHRIEKFPMKPGYHYTLVLEDVATKVVDVVEVKHYHMYPEGNGYLRPNTPVDYLPAGSIIPEGQDIYKNYNHDEHDNYRFGINAKVAYISFAENIEDGLIISESMSKRVKFWGIEEVEVVLNINDVLLDLYGDGKSYKSFPDIGEYVKDGVICGSRKVNYSQASAELTRESLRKSNFSDSLHYGEGQVVDIDIFVNKPEELSDNSHRLQLASYYYSAFDYYEKIAKALQKYLKKNSGYSCTLKVNDTFHWAKNYINQVKRSNSAGVFEFALVRLKIVKEKSLLHGYKMTNRFGGKGVVCSILPDDYMPTTKDGIRADVILSPPSVVGRANPGQNHSHELGFTELAKRKEIINEPDIKKKVKLIIDYLRLINQDEAAAFEKYVNRLSAKNLLKVITDIEQDGMFLRQPPFDNLTFEEIKNIYIKEGVRPQKIHVKRDFPNDKVREYISRNHVIVADEYMVVLKHTTESKFSTRTIGTVNSMGMPSKSGKKDKIGPHADTPIKIGEMELSNALTRVPPEIVHRLMATHGSNPALRNKLFNMLLEEDPMKSHDLPIDSEEMIDDIPALSFEAYLYCMGYEIMLIPNEDAIDKYETILKKNEEFI